MSVSENEIDKIKEFVCVYTETFVCFSVEKCIFPSAASLSSDSSVWKMAL